ncbi:GNAT family N-acetyltransferase [Neobacillus sp. D3-1R]|uniref:GNAT family N-acetyltransferase n=1 Tax=Neobacillus sp. D3-1R TaxID=3445778 RepID=UPI003F9FB187
MTIRKANEIETDYILKFSGNVINESSMGYAANNYQNSYNMFLPIILNGGYYLVEEENRKIKGWILLTKDRNLLTGKEIGHLLHLYVFPRYRDRGIGKQLMEAAIKELWARKIETVQLNVFTGNPAKAMYEKLGFKKISSVMELNINKA